MVLVSITSEVTATIGSTASPGNTRESAPAYDGNATSAAAFCKLCALIIFSVEDDFMTRYWIGVASYEHVRRGMHGGFAQLNHGKAAPLRRMAAGDWLIYYSPREQREGGEPVQAFTALGQLTGDEITEVAMSDRFTASRRTVHWLPTHPAPIKPLLGSLSFIRDPERWGMTFRPGHLEINGADFQRIAAAMGAEVNADAA